MSRTRRITAAALTAVFAAVLPAAAQASAPDAVPGEVIVRFATDAGPADRTDAREGVGAEFERKLPLPGVQLVSVEDGGERAAIKALERRDDVVYAEPNLLLHPTAVPNDPLLGELWGLNNLGNPVSGFGGTPVADADIDAPEAWDVTQGSETVTVAVLDSGISPNHPDLAPQLHPDGFDFFANDPDPSDFDTVGHGTHVAGTIGARGDDGFGVVGVNWRVKILPLRVCGGGDVGCPTSGIVAALAYAETKGARIANASLGGSGISNAMTTAAQQYDGLWVVAAGNDNTNNDSSPRSPCNVNSANVVCVASSNPSDGKSSFSNFGASSVDLAAPGSAIRSDRPRYDTIAADDFETNDFAARWTTGGTKSTWGRSAATGLGGGAAMSDSPGGNYSSSANATALLNAPLDLSGRSRCAARFDFNGTLGSGDSLRVEVSPDGVAWSSVGTLTGASEDNAYERAALDIRSVEGQAAARIRFRLLSDAELLQLSPGYEIDNFAVECHATAGFSSSTNTRYLSGTSMATPQVAGTAALMLADDPALTVAQLKSTLLSAVDPLPAFSGITVSGGRLNAARALGAPVAPPTPPPTPTPSGGTTTGGGTTTAPPTGKGSTPVVQPVTFGVGSLRTRDLKLARVRSGGLRVPVSCTGACSLNASAKISAKNARKLGLKRGGGSGQVTVAKGSLTLVGPGPGTLRLKLNSKAKKALRVAKRVPVVLKVSRGNSSVKRDLTLKR